MKKSKDFVAGETVIDGGRRFIIARIVIRPKTNQINFIDTNNVWHGPYSPEEFLGFAEVKDGN